VSIIPDVVVLHDLFNIDPSCFITRDSGVSSFVPIASYRMT
jgi:hypothetical protein